jgi:DMSO/TMAO reductase YedYZ molybdopterin-dependent catalytic subunit
LRQAPADHTGPIVKPTPPDLFINLGINRETRFEALRNRGYLVPNELFFVRNHAPTPHIDRDTWRLRIEGSGVESPIELTYEDVVSLDAQSVIKFVECAGNARGFFASQQGTPGQGSQWRAGAIGVAEWTGVPLRKVLERAGLKKTAVDVMPEGRDAEISPTMGHVRRPLPIEKALLDDTLLVYAMNGQVLPEDHGFPVRLLVPGWVGIASIKWVGRIEVSEEPLFSPWNTTTYRLFGDAYPDAPVLTYQNVKSAFELPFPAQLSAGRQILRGRSWSGRGKITQVEVSIDGGASWADAALKFPNFSQAWVRWDIEWDAEPGQYTLMARATDEEGNTQPAQVPFNQLGYDFWAVVNHPVTVV